MSAKFPRGGGGGGGANPFSAIRLDIKNIDFIVKRHLIVQRYMSRDMRFPTIKYVQPAKPQISPRIHKMEASSVQ